MGVITRKDIAEANAKLALGRKANLGLTTPSDRLVRHGSLPFIPYGAYDPTVGYSSSRCALSICIYTYLNGRHGATIPPCGRQCGGYHTPDHEAYDSLTGYHRLLWQRMPQLLLGDLCTDQCHTADPSLLTIPDAAPAHKHVVGRASVIPKDHSPVTSPLVHIVPIRGPRLLPVPLYRRAWLPGEVCVPGERSPRRRVPPLCRLRTVSEDGSEGGRTPLTVALADRPSPERPGPGFEHDLSRRVGARRPPPPGGLGAASGGESPSSARGESEMARLFRGPSSS